jgi:hypothetical protein
LNKNLHNFPASKKIHIIANQRSGSTWYQQVLSPYKINVNSLEFEPFNYGGILNKFKPSLEYTMDYLHKQEACVIKNQFNRLLEFDEFGKYTFDDLTNIPGFERVILLRRNEFEQCVSYALAMQTGEWQNTTNKDPIVITDKVWEYSKEFITTRNAKLYYWAKSNNDRIVWYEDVKTLKTTDRALNPSKHLVIKNIDELAKDYIS